MTGSFRGDRIARRGRTVRLALAGAATGVRHGGDRQQAGAGLTAWRQRPAPVRGRAGGSGPYCRPTAARVPPTPAPGGGPPARPSLPLGWSRAHAQSPPERGGPGTPVGRALEDSRRESCHRSRSQGRSHGPGPGGPVQTGRRGCPRRVSTTRRIARSKRAVGGVSPVGDLMMGELHSRQAAHQRRGRLKSPARGQARRGRPPSR